MTMTTPREITDQILQFGLSLVPGAVPVFVRYDPNSVGGVDDCFDNVAAVVREHGGSSLLGWTIWEWPGVLLEAIFHAVWERTDGTLLDPTPKTDGETTTLFIPDRNAIDEGVVTLSRHFPLVDWHEVNQYVEVCRTIGEAQQEYFPIYGGVPSGVWGPLLNNKEALAEAINRRQENVQAQKGILNGLAISESEAKRRFLASSADVEASIALARHSASRGDFGSAFRTLVQTAELDKRRAFEVRETFLQLFEACENREMVSVFRRQLGMLLHP